MWLSYFTGPLLIPIFQIARALNMPTVEYSLFAMKDVDDHMKNVFILLVLIHIWVKSLASGFMLKNFIISHLAKVNDIVVANFIISPPDGVGVYWIDIWQVCMDRSDIELWLRG